MLSKEQKEERRKLIVSLFYQGLNQEEISKRANVNICTVSQITTEYLKDSRYSKVIDTVSQGTQIERRLFSKLNIPKDMRTKADNKIIDELAPIYARFCA